MTSKRYYCRTWKKSVLFCDGPYGKFKREIADFLLVDIGNEGIKEPRLCTFGLTLTNDSGGVVVWIDSQKIREHSRNSVVSILVHELVHAAFNILGLSSVSAGNDNQEPLAYLVEELYNEFGVCVHKKVERMKRKKSLVGKSANMRGTLGGEGGAGG